MNQTELSKFLKKAALLFLGVAACSLVLIFTTEWFRKGDPFGEEMEVQKEKETLLQNTPSPKCILIGGSNIAFGVDSERLSNELQMPVVNMGLSASLGLYFMLNSVRPALHPGDILVVVPEYEHFFGDAFYGMGLVDQDFSDFTAWQQLCVIAQKKIGALKEKQRMMKYNLIHLLIPTAPGPRFRFSKSGFNSYGDYVAYLNEPSLNHIRLEVVNTAPFNNFSLKYLKRFNNYVLNHQAEMFIIYPSYANTTYRLNEQSITKLNRMLKQTFPNGNVLSSPLDYVFDDSLFFDSQYHLSKNGRGIRTDKMIENIKRGRLQNEDPPEIQKIPGKRTKS
jgi:hypothetical protein